MVPMSRFLAWVFLLSIPVAAGAVGGWEATWSPDGRQIAFTSSSPHGIPNIWVMDADGRNQRQLTALGGRAPRWMPDGRRIAFVSLRTGRPRFYVADPDAPAGADAPFPGLPEEAQDVVWSPSGKQAAYCLPNSSGKARDLWVASPDGSNPLGLTTNFWIREYAWSPRSDQIAIVIGRAIGSSLWVVDPETKELNLIYQGFCSSPAYSPDGKYLAFAVPSKKEDHRIVCLEMATGKKRLIPVRSFDGKSIRWSPDGKRMAFGSETKTAVTVWAAGLEDRDLVKVTPPDMQAFGPCFSPDGKRILFSATREDSQGADLYTCASDASVPFGIIKGLADKVKPEDLPRYTCLTNSSPTHFAPMWSPDGKRLAVAAVDRGIGSIYLVDNRRKKRKLTDFNAGMPMKLSWSPDGERIAFAQGASIEVLTTSGKSMAKLRLGGETTLSWSPDSATLYFTGWDKGRAGISAFSFETAGTDQLTKGGERMVETPEKPEKPEAAPAEPHAGLGVAGPVPLEQRIVQTVKIVNDLYPACSPDGKSVAFIRENQVWVISAGDKTESRITDFAAPESGEVALYDPSWSPDGKLVVFQVGRMCEGSLTWEIWMADVESKAVNKVVSEQATSEYVYFLRNLSFPAVFTPDGGSIVFTSVASGLGTIARVPSAGGQVETLADAPSSNCDVSPDGKIAYINLEGADERVFVRDPSTRRKQEIKLVGDRN